MINDERQDNKKKVRVAHSGYDDTCNSDLLYGDKDKDRRGRNN